RVRADLPPGVRVTVGPTASSTGWVLVYALVAPALRGTVAHTGAPESAGLTLLTLRRHQDEVLRPALSAVPGVAEVASLGGQTDEVVIETRPAWLRTNGVALSDVVAAARAVLAANPKAGTAELSRARIDGKAIADVARVAAGGGMTAGMADLDGYAPVVGGIVIAERHTDVTALIGRVQQVLERERARLPGGVSLAVVYDRSELAGRVQRTLLRAVAEEIGMVVLVVLLFLLHGRSALLPLATLPVIMLVTFAGMWALGVPATVVSLGGIAIALGIAVDADIVALEAGHRALASPSDAERHRGVAASFAPAILTSVIITGLAFVPVFALGGETGRLLRPLAATKTLVIAAAALVSLTLAPALRRLLLRGRVRAEMDNPLTRALVRAYRPFVRFALARPAFTLATAALATASAIPVALHLGGEFLPRIDEGDLLFMPTTAAGVAPADAARQLAIQDRALAAQPEVAAVLGKVGRADTATDPAPYSMAETIVRLKPRSAWPAGGTTNDLIDRLDRAARLPGWTSAWTFPARARADMMSTGVRTPVAVRIAAPDLARIDALAAAVQRVLLDVPGTRSASYESSGGEPRLAFDVDTAAAARFGVDPALARSTADLLLAGGQIGESLAGGRRARVRISLAAPGEPGGSITEELLREASVRASPERGLPSPQPSPASGRGGKIDSRAIPLALLGRPRTETVP
ncbi:MAG TPA: efflux RND transporter permease subunit, partial [Polyangia bacterium]|nr:efflux RND transporter permease subunit [Polyangia bacterium]